MHFQNVASVAIRLSMLILLPAAIPKVPLATLLALIVLYVGPVFLFSHELGFDLCALFVRVSHLAFARFLVALAREVIRQLRVQYSGVETDLCFHSLTSIIGNDKSTLGFRQINGVSYQWFNIDQSG